MKHLLPPPHQIVIKPGGNYFVGLWLALWLIVISVLACLVGLVGCLLRPITAFIGGTWICGQYLGYALFGHVRYEDITPGQWMQQGLGAKWTARVEAKANRCGND